MKIYLGAKSLKAYSQKLWHKAQCNGMELQIPKMQCAHTSTMQTPEIHSQLPLWLSQLLGELSE